MALRTWMLVVEVMGLCTGATVHLYVSPHGADSNTGVDVNKPLKTLEKAKARLDDHDVTGSDVFVEILGGFYDLADTLHFTHGYSGKVTFRAYQDQEVHVTGGRKIDVKLFSHVTDATVLNRLPQMSRSKVLRVDLKAAGITSLGQLSNFGAYTNRHAPLEVFINGQALHLAQWPDTDFIDITAVPDGASGLRFQYSTDRDARWVGEKDPWVYGYWMFSWADYGMAVRQIDPHAHIITLASASPFGIKTGHHLDLKKNDQGGYFRVINMLSELDQPGEYYLDKSTGVLYLLPNTPSGTLGSSDRVYVSLLDSCLKLDQGVHGLVFQGFTVENCRLFGVEAHAIHDVTLQNMEIKNTGSYSFHCDGDCRRVTLSHCEIHHGDGGVFISGGDRIKLESSGNILEDNHIWQFSRVSAVDQHGVSCNGVNNILRYNHIHDGQYTAVRWSGNDHVMEYNHLHHLCLVASDCGAFHTGRDWTYRGNVVRYNYVHHTLRPTVGAPVRGVMLDDQASSVLIEHNVFYDNEVHVNIGGSRDVIVRFNVFYNATSESIQVDGRGQNERSNDGELITALRAVPYTNALWSAKYPKLAAMNVSKAGLPEGNEIYSNTFYNSRGIRKVNYVGVSDRKEFFDLHDNHQSVSPTDYWSPKDADFRLRCTAEQWANAVNFQQPITIDQVGPRSPTGPKYLGTRKGSPHTGGNQAPCAGTAAPAKVTPRAPYLPDGANTTFRLPHLTDTIVAKEGCWMVTTGCPTNPAAKGTYRDTYGEEHEGATTQGNCLARAYKQWQYYCGSPKEFQVYSVFAPTGATSMAGYGCYMIDYGCPLQGSSTGTGSIYRDSWAEQNQNAANDEEKCLSRAVGQYYYCGADPQYPITSVYGPKGSIRTAGAGCWIRADHCPANSKLSGLFYDAWGATNLATDDDMETCFERATYFWQQCGSHKEYPVTAYFRPSAASKTVP